MLLSGYLIQEAGDDLCWGEFASLVSGRVVGSTVVPIRNLLILGADIIGSFRIRLVVCALVELYHSWVVSGLVVIELSDLPQDAKASVTPQEGPNEIELRSATNIRLEI